MGNLYFQGVVDRALGQDLIFEASYSDEEGQAGAGTATSETDVVKATDDDEGEDSDTQQQPSKHRVVAPSLRPIGTSITRIICTRVSIEKKEGGVGVVGSSSSTRSHGVGGSDVDML